MDPEQQDQSSPAAQAVTREKKVSPAFRFVVLVVALIVFGVVIAYLRPVRRAAPEPEEPEETQSQTHPGDKIELPGENWEANGLTVLLVMSVGCDHCEASAPFYKELLGKLGNRKDVHVVAVLPQSVGQSKDFLDRFDLNITDVKQASLSSIGAKGTPTVMVVDKSGVVTDLWLGTLNDARRSEILKRLKVPESRPGVSPALISHIAALRQD
ncbi:MAG TPA: redoxin family protein [Blastocatellia bacterium]|nr:redoxin family protein [Blastocatellia bacterium]